MWFLNSSCNPYKKNIRNYLKAFNDSLDSHSSKYEKTSILGDFNVKQNMKTFLVQNLVIV